jgi:hypothetical protein
VASGWWLVAGAWLLNLQFVINDPMSQEEPGTYLPAISHHLLQPPNLFLMTLDMFSI